MANDKRVLTPAEFEKLTESINKRIYELSSIYIAILARDAGIDFETICTEFGNQADQTDLFLEEINEEFDVDLRNISEEAFLNKIPSRYEETFKQIKEQYLNSDVKEVSEADSEAYNLLQKEVALEEENVARNISNYDLSQIPSEFYNSAKWIRKVNFENTGAKLDLRQFDFNVYITGSIKGCDLISFKRSAYGKIINDGTREDTMYICPTKESLDENQYETVIEGYKDDKSPYIASGLYDLLTAPELQEKNEWVFDKAFKSEHKDDKDRNNQSINDCGLNENKPKHHCGVDFTCCFGLACHTRSAFCDRNRHCRSACCGDDTDDCSSSNGFG